MNVRAEVGVPEPDPKPVAKLVRSLMSAGEGPWTKRPETITPLAWPSQSQHEGEVSPVRTEDSPADELMGVETDTDESLQSLRPLTLPPSVDLDMGQIVYFCQQDC